MKWAYGVTTVPERRYNLLPATLESLRLAGFERPTLFIDGPGAEYDSLGLPYVRRDPKILAFGNWWLSLQELYIRNPHYDRYALFQDDFETYRNLRNYIEAVTLSDDYYWNLYTFPQNEEMWTKPHAGWYTSNQRGRGAVALVFNNTVVRRLLSSPIMIEKPRHERNNYRSIDGVVVTAMTRLGIKEVVHYPTLVMHTGTCSAIGNRQHDRPRSWLGPEFDATDFLREVATT